MAAYALLITSLYSFLDFKFLSIPWAVLPVLGVAISFYLGFKNNSAYDRTWEARKIWGAIVNSSRSWGILARDLVSTINREDLDEKELKKIRRTLIYRHIAWLYKHRQQLLTHRQWEHYEPHNKPYREHLAKNFFHLSKEEELSPFLHPTEMNQIMNAKNGATQLIANQSAQLTELRKRKILNDFQHMEMERMLIDFYTQQGKNERIKNFPLPRQYATSSLIFTYLFIGLLPLGLTQAFDAMGPWMVFMTIPFTVLVGWVFIIMEIVGDYAENPFEGLAFDIPMTNLCRTIEIDLREMLGEEDLPPPIEPVGNVLL